MKRLLITICVLSLAGFFASCDTTGTYVKDDASIPSAIQDEPSVKTADTAESGAPKETDKSADIKVDSDTVAVIGKYVLTKEKYRILR